MVVFNKHRSGIRRPTGGVMFCHCEMKLLLTVLGLVALCAGEGYLGSQVIKLVKDGEGVIDQIIAQQKWDVWGGNLTHLEVLVPKESVQGFKRFLSRNQVPYDVMIEDLEKAIQEENRPAAGAARSLGRAGSRMNWNQYQRLGSIHEYLESLTRAYPFVSVGVMGKSHEGRSLKYIKISSGKPNAKAVFIDGGIHAREWISPASVTYIIRELVENRDRLPKDIQDLDFYVLPVFNPDGYEYTHTHERMWRKNRSKENRGCMGADLNRNFDFKFGGKGTSGDACSDTYRGRQGASEPETQAFQKFIRSISQNLKAYITFHSYGQYILIPYGYDNNQYAPDFPDMERVGKQAARAMRESGGQSYTVGNTANTLYPAAGGSDDWVKANFPGVKYVYCIELRDSGNNGFLLPASQIIPTGKEAFEAIKVIASAAAKA